MTSPPHRPQHPPPARKNRDVPGWIQVGLGVLAFFGIGGAIFGIDFDKPHPDPTPPTVTAAPGPTTNGPRPTTTTRRTTRSPVPPPAETATDDPPAPADAPLIGTWKGTSQLSAYESTSLPMTLSLGGNGRYAWTRDVIHDSGYWEIAGDYIAFEQDGGGQYQWPYQLSGSGSRQILWLITEQGGTTKLRRA